MRKKGREGESQHPNVLMNLPVTTPCKKREPRQARQTPARHIPLIIRNKRHLPIPDTTEQRPTQDARQTIQTKAPSPIGALVNSTSPYHSQYGPIATYLFFLSSPPSPPSPSPSPLSPSLCTPFGPGQYITSHSLPSPTKPSRLPLSTVPFPDSSAPSTARV